MTGRKSFADEPPFRAALSDPFAAGQVGKLPRVTDKGGAKSWCGVCKNTIPKHIHLDFVGHAVVTGRLNAIAPDWTYSIEHIDRAPNGDVLGILGNMTIGGKTLPEAGSPDVPSPFGEAMKGAISDFIRRGAMRFGVALDLWTKEVLESTGEAGSGSGGGGGGGGGTAPLSAPAAGEPKDSGVGGDSPQNARVYGEGTRAGPKAEAAHTGTTEQPALDGSMPPSEAQMERLQAVYGPRWQFAVLKAAASSYGRSIAVTDLTGAQVEELILAKAGAA